jgi:O-antigen/teichoic acid export membrane protein
MLFAGWRFFISAIMTLITLLIIKPTFSRSYEERSILKDARPYALSELLAIIYMQVDVNILYFFRGAFAVGTYSPALNMTNALFVIPNAVFNFVVPSLTRLYTYSRMAFLRKCKEVLLLMLAIGVALTAGLALSSRPLTQLLLGEQYNLSGGFLLGLSPILLFKSLEFGFAAIIVAAKAQRRRLVPQVLAAVLNLLLNFILIPLIAANGAVIAYLVTEAVLLVSYGIVAIKLLIGARNGN